MDSSAEQEVESAPSTASHAANLARCATCRHATDVVVNEGRLRCLKYDMLIDADADEIPDDCAHFEKA